MGLASGLIEWGIAGFCIEFFIPTTVGANTAIWQNKVSPEIQGRVFASRRIVTHLAAFIAMVIVGPLADEVFEPAMIPSGRLASVFGGIIPPGPGAGMALMFVISGLLGSVVSIGGYAFQSVRDVESLLPDIEIEVETG